MFDYNIYIGIPWVSGGRSIEEDGGLDCWGLVYDIYKNKYNVILPRLDSLDITQGSSATNIKLQGYYPSIREVLEEVSDVREGDILLFNEMGEPLHVGLAVDRRHMIHMRIKLGCVLECFTSREWDFKHVSTHRLRNT